MSFHCQCDVTDMFLSHGAAPYNYSGELRHGPQFAFALFKSEGVVCI